MSEEKEAQLSIICMYTQTGENDEISMVSKRIESFYLEWIHRKKTYSCDQQLTPAECEVLTQVSYVFYFSIFLEQNYFKMFDCFHHLSKSHINN